MSGQLLHSDFDSTDNHKLTSALRSIAKEAGSGSIAWRSYPPHVSRHQRVTACLFVILHRHYCKPRRQISPMSVALTDRQRRRAPFRDYLRGHGVDNN